MSLPSSGDVIGGKYRIGNVMAEGGMGIVVEGLHVQLEEAVAIKFLNPAVVGAAGDEAVKRFMREARTCIRIRSEHVVRVLDVDTLPSGVPYMVMERLTGRDLDAIVETSGPLNATSAIDHVLQALEALAEAHSLGVIHRDLKPANLFLAERADGSPCIKVLDFGISKIENPLDGGMTQTQAVLGSPRYMSPEQLRASRNVDARTDIWSMGVVLYELMTGRAPFNGSSMTQVTAAILEEIPAPLALRVNDATAIEAVVMRCLAKRAEDRFANVSDLAAALAPFGSPSAAVSAARVYGVIHRGAQPSVSHPSLPPMAPLVERSASAKTEVAWGDTRASSSSHRRLGIFAALAAAVVIVGIALVTMSLRGKEVPAAVAAPPPPVSIAAPRSASPLPEASAAQPATAVVTAASTTPSSPSTPPPPPRATTMTTTTTTKARTSASPTPSAVPTPASTTWSDRK